jgi:hypothetical protein
MLAGSSPSSQPMETPNSSATFFSIAGLGRFCPDSQLPTDPREIPSLSANFC